jgi:hypothetical protein
VQLAPKTRGRMPTKPRGRMDVPVVPWMTARYYSLTLKRAPSCGDIHPAVCQPCVPGTRPRVFRRESHTPHVARPTPRERRARLEPKIVRALRLCEGSQTAPRTSRPHGDVVSEGAD